MLFKKKTNSSEGTTIFFCTDLHGSTICFKKFINAAAYYTGKGRPVQILMMGGDVAGKLIVPIIKENGHYRAYMTGMNWDMTTQEELADFYRKCETLGVYQYVFTPDEYSAFDADKASQDKLFHQLILKRLEEWIEFAERKLDGQNVTCYMNPGNDDFAEVDDVLDNAKAVMHPEGKVVRIDGEHEMISCGYSNITPFNCPRDIPEEALKERLEAMIRQVERLETCVFNLHVPPMKSGLDTAPKLDENLRPQIGPQGLEMAPVGSTSVREVIEKHQPMLALHGHIHESRATTNIGRTLCVNPGSEYSEGILRGALVTIKGNKVINHMLTSG